MKVINKSKRLVNGCYSKLCLFEPFACGDLVVDPEDRLYVYVSYSCSQEPLL